MFVNVAGWMISGVGLPVAAPATLASSGVAIALGLVVGIAAGAIAVASGLGSFRRRTARRGRAGCARGLTLVSRRAVVR